MNEVLSNNDIVGLIFGYLDVHDIRSLGDVAVKSKMNKFSRLVLTELLNRNSIVEPAQKCNNRSHKNRTLYCENCGIGEKTITKWCTSSRDTCGRIRKHEVCVKHYVGKNACKNHYKGKTIDCSVCKLTKSVWGVINGICSACRSKYFCSSCTRRWDPTLNKCQRCGKGGCMACSDVKNITCMGLACRECYNIVMNYRRECPECHRKTVRSCNCGHQHCDSCGHKIPPKNQGPILDTL